jgi:eukaryotic-like serine/threonine-protein kinase
MSNGSGPLPPNDELDSRQVLSRIVDFDEALAAGLTIDLMADETLQTLAEPDRRRLDRILRCLQFLDKARRVQKSTKANRKTADSGHIDTSDLSNHSKIRLKVGRFEVVRELGRGGHGVVFLANDLLLRRQVALKVPRPEFILSPEMSRRFVGEAQAAAALDHSNILKIFEAGSDGAISYIAQELCSGPSLADWLRASADGVAPSVAAQIVRDLARGVQHAHERGVLHRDLKPANVLLQPSEGSGVWGQARGETSRGGSGVPIQNPKSKIQNYELVPKLADFGIAKVFDEEGDKTATLTGAAIGTVAYMSPEQAAGRTSQIGPRSDVYGLGAIFYELLTGRPPFELDSRLATLRRVVTDQPPAPRSLRPEIPADLEAICLKCLEKSRQERYSTAGDLVADLQRYLNGEAVRARPTGRLRRTVRRLRRQPPSILIAMAAIVILAVLFSASLLAIWAIPRAPASGREELPANLEAGYLGGIERVAQGYFDAVSNRGDVKMAVQELDAFLERHRPRPGQADYRGFEWHYLWRLCHPDKVAKPFPKLFDLVGHKGEVYSVTFSPGGGRIATAGQDHTGRIWDASTGKLLTTLVGHSDDVNWISFFPGPEIHSVLTAGDDKTIRIWDYDSGKQQAFLSDHESKVVAVGVALVERHDGDDTKREYQIIAGDDAGRLLVWDWTTRHRLRTLSAHGGRIQALARMRGDDWWITASADGTAKEWNGESWTPIRAHVMDVADSNGGGAAAIYSVACSTDATLAAFGWGRGAQSRNSPFGPATSASRSVVGAAITIDDLLTGTRWLTVTGQAAGAWECVRFVPGHCALVSTCRDAAKEGGDEHHVMYCDVSTQKFWKPFGGTHPGSWCVAFSPDGTRMASAGDDGVVRVWDSSLLPGGRRLENPTFASAGSPTSIDYSADGKRLLVSYVDWDKPPNARPLQIWDVSGDRPTVGWTAPPEKNHRGSFTGCFSADGRWIAIDESDVPRDPIVRRSVIRVIDAESFREDRELDGYEGVAHRILLPDGNHVVAATGSIGGEHIQLSAWLGPHGGHADRTWEPTRAGDFLATTLSSDGKFLATNRGDVEIYQFPSLRLVERLPVDAGRCTAICFSRDGGLIAAAFHDGTIRLWQPRSRRPPRTLMGDGHVPLSLAFSTDGTRLAVGLNGAARVDLWHVPSGKRLAPLAMPTDLPSVTALSFSPDGRALASAYSTVGRRGSVLLFPIGKVDAPTVTPSP